MSHVGLCRYLGFSVISYQKSLNTSLVEVMKYSKNELIFTCDLRELTLKIIFDACWASVNVDVKCFSAWNESRHVPSRHFYLHCRIQPIGSAGIICIICGQVVHDPSHPETSSV